MAIAVEDSPLARVAVHGAASVGHVSDLRDRIAAALRAVVASDARGDVASLTLGVAESLADHGSLDVDDLRLRDGLAVPGDRTAALLVAAVPFGVATPLDRPRLRRDAYRFAAATGADEGTAVTAVAAALVAADLGRFDAAMTAIRVRQSLLEDAPMALLDRFQLFAEPGSAGDADDDDAGATLQLALSAAAWHEQGTAPALGGVAGILAAAFVAIRTGACDLPIDAESASVTSGLAERLAEISTAAYAES